MKDKIEQSDLFDAAWYLDRYPDVRMLGMNPAEHYLRIGARLLRDPGPEFSTAYYLAANPDVKQAGVNPLWHYLAHGRDEGRKIVPAGSHLPGLPSECPVPVLEAVAPQDWPARVICFYLPQFHAIPENDAWWGAGFTEWTNVRPAQPQFIRHYQPHEPGELGYYDLSTTIVQRRQIELAKLYGVGGFCFYFYWFAGKRLLETPIRNYLEDDSLDFPFCLCWANENWSRRWDGRDHDVLIAQQHSEEDDLAFIGHVAQYMRDSRYIRVDGKPLLLVYRPNLLPDPVRTVERWRQWCRKQGLGEIYLAYTQSFESNNPEDYGFDAAIEFPPNNSCVPLVTNYCKPNANFEGRIFDWTALVERSYLYPNKDYKLFRGVCPSWDNTARRGANATILKGSNPPQFARWVTNAIRDTTTRFKKEDERLVFVNAWNEWAEGAHLEPDLRYGYAWLESVRVALCAGTPPRAIALDSAVAIVIEAFDINALTVALKRCERLSEQNCLFVAVPASMLKSARPLLEASGRSFVLDESVRDRQGPYVLSLLREGRLVKFDVIFRLDLSVQDVGREDHPGLELLDEKELEQALAKLAADRSLGMLCPDACRSIAAVAVAGTVGRLGLRLGLRPDEISDSSMWQGQAFLAKTQALMPLASLAIPSDGYSPGTASYDRHLLVALDRCFALSAISCSLRVATLHEAIEPVAHRRMVIVSHDAHPHGAQLLAMNMASEYRKLGFEVDMLVLGPGRLLDRFREVATVHEISLDEHLTSSTLRLLCALRSAGAEVALANTTVSGHLVPLLKRAGFRVVSLIHELPGILGGYKLQEQAKAIAEQADAVVYPARIVREGFQNFVGRDVTQGVIRPQGLYLKNPHHSGAQRQLMCEKIRFKHDLRSDAKIILCAGYADFRKGLDLFAEACIQVMRTDPRVIGMWIGHADAAFLAEVQRGIETAGFTDRFVFTGLVENPQDYYTAADIYALTSREDPYPSVVMESLDAHVPVVSFSGVVGSEELLERGCGLMVPAFDTRAMAGALSKLLSDPDLSGEMARCGHDIVHDELVFRHYLYDLMEVSGKPIPKVSVIVPNYNYARYIAERLVSIEQQTAPIYELIVLDDNSTDESVEIIAKFLENCAIPSRLIVNEKNSGSVFRQWALGADLAKGDFIWIAEADDLAAPEFIEETLKGFETPGVVISYTQSRQMDVNGKITCEDYLDYVSDIDRERWMRSYVVDGRDEIATALYLKNTIPNVSGVVFKRKELQRVLADHGEEITRFKNAGDWVVYLRILENGKISYSPRALNSHRRHEHSVTLGNFNIGQLLEITEVQQEAINRHGLDEKASLQADRYAQKLYQQFGLLTTEYPEYCSHPAFVMRKFNS